MTDQPAMTEEQYNALERQFPDSALVQQYRTIRDFLKAEAEAQAAHVKPYAENMATIANELHRRLLKRNPNWKPGMPASGSTEHGTFFLKTNNSIKVADRAAFNAFLLADPARAYRSSPPRTLPRKLWKGTLRDRTVSPRAWRRAATWCNQRAATRHLHRPHHRITSENIGVNMNQPVQQLAGRRRAGILDAMSQGLTQPTPPRISIKAQKFTLVDAAGVQIPVQMFDPQYGLYLDVVIIGVNPNKSKMYYEFDYDPTKDEPPTCFSDNGVGPSSQATTPQSPTCAMCPNNAWGSDTSKMTGKPTKACSDRKKLAVIVVNDPSQLVYQLQIPPASLKHLSVLANALKGHQVTDSEGPRAADPADVVTRVYFNPQKQGELLFQPMGFHQQMAPYIMDLIDKADASGVIELAIGTNDVPYQGAIALPNPQVVQALPAPAQQMQAPPPPAPHAGVPMATQSFAPQGQPLVQPTPQPAPLCRPPRVLLLLHSAF
jgi:hypothetical protein